LLFNSTGIPVYPENRRACAPSRYTAQIANAWLANRHRSLLISSVGARPATAGKHVKDVPERANITVAPHTEINPTHSFASSHRVQTHLATCGTGPSVLRVKKIACATKIATTSNGVIAPSSYAWHGMPCPY
jgi:hypothetical protein